MIIKNEDAQEQTKRLRFKSISNTQHSSGDVSFDKGPKETKCKGKYFVFSIAAYVNYITGYLYL